MKEVVGGRSHRRATIGVNVATTNRRRALPAAIVRERHDGRAWFAIRNHPHG
jgi:hypothetical protein